MMIDQLQYISQQTKHKSHLEHIKEICVSGGKWIQLRIKNESEDLIMDQALKAKEICDQYGAKLIINDHVKIAQKVKAHGVHVGSNDMNVAKARVILGNGFIIGGTANTVSDIKNLAAAKVDYIGLGPFRFTETKKNLSPVLGLEGYKKILSEIKNLGISIPVVAIGGITKNDITDILTTGVHGIAVSGLLTKSDVKQQLIDEVYEKLRNSPLRSFQQLQTLKTQ